MAFESVLNIVHSDWYGKRFITSAWNIIVGNWVGFCELYTRVFSIPTMVIWIACMSISSMISFIILDSTPTTDIDGYHAVFGMLSLLLLIVPAMYVVAITTATLTLIPIDLRHPFFARLKAANTRIRAGSLIAVCIFLLIMGLFTAYTSLSVSNEGYTALKQQWDAQYDAPFNVSMQFLMVMIAPFGAIAVYLVFVVAYINSLLDWHYEKQTRSVIQRVTEWYRRRHSLEEGEEELQ